MRDDPRRLYLDLLKKALVDYFRVDSEHANAMPLEWADAKTRLKAVRNRLLARLMWRLGFVVAKRDRRMPAERRRLRESGRDWPPFATTMVGLRRLENLEFAIETVLAERIPGDLVEAGVWRGGASIFMRGVLKAHGADDRRLWLCDSFAGLPPPDAQRYPADAGDKHHTYSLLAVPQAEVEENFRKYGLLDAGVRFVPGFFEDTLAGLPAARIALLRLDGDMYGSTMVALDALYDRVAPGGFVIIDDYLLPPCRQAVSDFRDRRGIDAELVAIDDYGVYWRKAPAAQAARIPA